MNLYYPTSRPYAQTQGFNQNLNPLYASQGMSGHTGCDEVGQYGETIYAATDCYLYSFLNAGASPEK